MKIIGLTGGIGSGKSTVLELFKILGVKTYSSDESDKKLVNTDPYLINLIKSSFGENIYDKICVVENLADMWAIESSNIYKGHFHILGGTLNSNENYEQKNLLIDSLVRRVKKNSLKEVIIATSATIEGQTTAHYI